MKPIERRSLQSQTDAGNLRLSIPFNSWSEDLGGFRERIAPGAFDRTVKDGGAEVLGLWNHNTDMPLARRSNGSLELAADQAALSARITGDQTSWAEDARQSIAAGTVKGGSFAFITHEDNWERGRGEWKRTLLDVELIEVSPTPAPAYPGSTATV